jgi:hypothetical protein
MKGKASLKVIESNGNCKMTAREKRKKTRISQDDKTYYCDRKWPPIPGRR